MISLRAQAMILLLKVINRRKIYLSRESLLKGISDTRKAGPAKPTQKQEKKLLISRVVFQERDVYRLQSHRAPPVARVIYFHGGAYVRPITSFHWRMLADLVEQTGMEFIVPLYPLAPENNGLSTLQFVTDLYDQETFDGLPILLMGDSAGGGLALALAGVLKSKPFLAPRRLILISPCVDMEMSNPKIASIETTDPMLHAVGVREAGRLYAGALSLSHPAISPANGDMVGLPPMTIFLAGRDIVSPDAMAYATTAMIRGCNVDLHIEQDMFHVWPIFGFPEAIRTRKEIVKSALSSI